MISKPFSQACENNKVAIENALKRYFDKGGDLLEVGSGTGQHGFYFSEHFSQLTWHTSDQAEYLEGINAWVVEADRENFKAPFILNVNENAWSGSRFDYVFSANTTHIMSWNEVERFFELIPRCLKAGGYFFLYGPFNYEGQFTSDSNARFNEWLKSQAAHRAIRDFEAIQTLAERQGLILIEDTAMPANNRLLQWQLKAYY